MRCGVLVVFALVAAVARQYVGVGGALTPVDFKDEPVAEGIPGLPTDFAFMPPGQTERILVTDFRGMVQVIVRGAVQEKLFLDERVSQEERDNFVGYGNFGDRGIAPEYRAVAVDSDFENFPYVYFAYIYYPATVEGPGEQIPMQGFVKRYRVASDRSEVIRSTGKIIIGNYVNGNCLDVDVKEDNYCVTRPPHNMCGLLSDPSGRIWITTGDSAFVYDSERPLAMRSQDVDSLYGKVLRVNRNGLGLNSNPYYNGDPRANRSKVMALGLRNPWNIHWDDALGTAWVSEVGEATLEEFNLVRPRANFEWPCFESELDRFQFGIFPECADMLNDVPPSSGVAYTGTRAGPAFSYSHREGSANTGVAPVNIEGWPEAFNHGVYFCDYTGNWIRYVKVDETGTVVSEAIDFATEVLGPVNIRTGNDGCLYYLALTASKLGKICYSEDNSPPQVLGIVPPNGFSGVARSTVVEVAVSKKVMEETALAAVSVVETVSGQSVAGVTEWDETRNILTFVPNELLEEDTMYTVTVSGLIDLKGISMTSEVASTFVTGTGFVRYLSDLVLTVDPNPSRVVRDMAEDGVSPITIRGKRFRKGLSFNPVVLIDVQVPDGCTSIEGYYGIDDISRRIASGAVIFTIAVDGTFIYDSTVDGLGIPSRKVDPEFYFRLPVESGSTVTLRGDFGDLDDIEAIENRGVWADAAFRCGNLDSSAPKVESFEPGNGESTSTNPVIRIAFDEPMNYNTIIQAVTIESADGRRIPWLPVDSTNPQTFLLAVEELDFDETYVVTISKLAADVSGNRLEEDVQWSFTTESPPASGQKVQLVEDLIPRRVDGGVSFNGFPREFVPGVQVYSNGLGMQPEARIGYDLSGLACTRLKGTTGKDAAAGGDSGACRLRVYSGASEETSRKRLDRYPRAAQPARGLGIDLDGDEYLEIRLSAGGDQGGSRDFCDIVRPRVECDGADIYLTSLTPLFEQGIVEKNRSAVRLPLQLFSSSMTFETGVVLPAGSEATYTIPGRCSTVSFTVGAGLGADFGDTELVTTVDGEAACTGQSFFHRDGARTFFCSVEGGKELKFQAVEGLTKGAIIVGEAELDCAVGIRKPVCEISSLPVSFRVGDTIEYAGKAYRFNGEELPASAISWDITLVHCEPECHDHPDTRVEGREGGSYDIPDHGDYFFIKIDCTVTDMGEISKTSTSVLPETVLVTVESTPTGKVAVVDGTNGETPLSKTLVVGSTITVDADPVGFEIWSHDNALGPTFNYFLQDDTPIVFTANYS